MILNIILFILAMFFLFLTLKYKSKLSTLKKNNYREEKNKVKEQHVTFEEELNSIVNNNTRIVMDPLTGLPGRAAFEDRMSQVLKQSKRFENSFAALLLDVNNFKSINSEFGHEFGDKLLIEIAKRLEGVIRQIDTISRYAGDKFIFLLPMLSMPETAAYVAQRLLDSTVQPFKVEDTEITITASIGIALYPMDGNEVSTLLKNAENALQLSKNEGKGKYKFYRKLLQNLSEKDLNIHDFFANEDYIQKLTMLYQPTMNVVDNTIVYLQPVVFLDIPKIGLLHFNEFAKQAQTAGAMQVISAWIIKNAFKQFNVFKNTKQINKIALQVTLQQISNDEFMNLIETTLTELEIPSQDVIFQIEEKNIFTNNATLENAFKKIKTIGIQIALSIYALGHFALHKITKLPIDYLILDANLLKGSRSYQESETILFMIVTLAKEMQIKIAAKNVETEKQKDLLQSFGCEMMQGRLMGSPQPAEILKENMDR